MEWLKRKIFGIEIDKYLKTGLQGIIYIIVGVAGLILLQNTIISSIPAIFSNVGVGFLILYLFDRFALKSIDTIDEIKKGNVAFAIVYLGWTLIVSAAIMAT